MSGQKKDSKAVGHVVQTAGFPLIDYDPSRPITKETIDAAISWVMSNLQWIHEGMDGRSPRFNILSTKPTREQILTEMSNPDSFLAPNLDFLESRIRPTHLDEFDEDSEVVDEEVGEEVKEVSVSKEQSSVDAAKLSQTQKSDLTKELEIRLKEWAKDKNKFFEYLNRLFGVIRGNQTRASKHVVEKHPLWKKVDHSKDGILLWLLILKTHAMANVRQPELSMTAAENGYFSFKMTKDMTLLEYKNEFELRVRTLEGARAPVPSEETLARHFIDKLDMSRYGRFVEAVHNKIYKFPKTIESAHSLAESKVVFKSAGASTKTSDSSEVPSFTSYAMESSAGGSANGSRGKGRNKKKRGNSSEKAGEKSDRKSSEAKVAAAPTTTNDSKKGGDTKKSSGNCFGCGKEGHLLKDCPKREKLLSKYSKKQSGSSMAAVSEEDDNIFVSWPLFSDSYDDDSLVDTLPDLVKDDDDELDCEEHDAELSMKSFAYAGINEDFIEEYNSQSEDEWIATALGNNDHELSLDHICLAVGPLNAKSLLLDTGSDIHLTPSADTPGLVDVTIADPPFRVKGVGHGSVLLNQVGYFGDMGPMYIGKAPCTIISLGLAVTHGAKVKWSDDMSEATVTTKNGARLTFKRRKQIWICNDYDADALMQCKDAVAIAFPTEAEMMLKYNRHELKQSEEAAEYLKRLRYPGRGTAKSIVTSGALRNLPVTTKGLNIRFDIAGQELAAEKGGRKKFSPKLSPDIINESILSEERSSTLFVDLFFLNKFAFLLGAFYVPYCERAIYIQQFLSKGKGVESITAAITSFVGVMRSNKVKVELIQCDMESAVGAAKPALESSLKVKVEQIGDNVAEIERGIQSVKMVCRKVKAGLPFNLYGILFVFLVAWAVSGLNLWTSPNFPSKLAPKEALTGRKPDAARELNASFGDYLRTDATNAEFTNNLDSRAIEALALTPLGNDRGEWYCLSLETFRVITRCIRPGDIVPIPTRVINLVNAKAAKWNQQMQFSNRRGLIGDIDDGDILQAVPHSLEDRSESESYADMTGIPADIVTHEEVSESIADESNAGVQNTGVQMELQSATELQFASVPNAPSAPNMPDANFENSPVEVEPVSIESSKTESSERQIKSPLPYNSNLRSKPTIRGANRLDSLQSLGSRSLYVSKRKDDIGRAYSFHMSLLKGLRKHKDAGFEAMLKELLVVHESGTIAGVDYSKLTSAQKSRAIRSMLFFKEKYKPDGSFDKLKARLVAGGHQQDRTIYSESDTSSPTVATEAVMMVSAIAARERRHVVTIDIGGAFLKGKFHDGADPVIMRLDKELADTLCAIDRGYEAYQRPDGSVYVKLTRPLYGLIQAAKLWYEEISSTLKKEGFMQNEYDQCTWNRDFKGCQHTVILHVDDLKSTCCNDEANQQLIVALRRKYKDINVQEGLIHPYLGMTFDYSVVGKVRVTQDGYVQELVASEDIKSALKTPAAEDLFVVDKSSPELSKDAKEHFHSLTAKLLYLSKRTRPDILVAVSFLTSRVQIATQQDGAKLTRVLRYLYGTQDLGIVLEADEELLNLYCYIDASFAVHQDMKSHTGTLVTLGKGPIMAKSVKQKINTKSSTESELVGLSDSVSLVIWCRNFLESQGYRMPAASVFQDNLSTIAMIRSGKPTSDRTRHVNIRFFFVHDKEANGEIKVEYKATKQMIADIFTKPLQGELFVQLRNELLNVTK